MLARGGENALVEVSTGTSSTASTRRAEVSFHRRQASFSALLLPRAPVAEHDGTDDDDGGGYDRPDVVELQPSADSVTFPSYVRLFGGKLSCKGCSSSTCLHVEAAREYGAHAGEGSGAWDASLDLPTDCHGTLDSGDGVSGAKRSRDDGPSLQSFRSLPFNGISCQETHPFFNAFLKREGGHPSILRPDGQVS